MTENADDNLTQVENFPETDWLIVNLVETLNALDDPACMPMILSVSGKIVSGSVIGGKEYFELMAEAWAAMAGEENADGVRKKYLELAKAYGSDAEEKPAHIRYLHMRNARFFFANGDPIPGNRGLLWRCKLSSVDGFAYGQLEAQTA